MCHRPPPLTSRPTTRIRGSRRAGSLWHRPGRDRGRSLRREGPVDDARPVAGGLTRRLAERIEFSLPVLYSHFRGKREIIGAVALEGASEMAAALRAAASAADADGPRARVTALARAYLDFAERNPAVYDAMFRLDGGLAFAHEDTPAPLKDAFAALLENLGEAAGDGVHPALFAETFWAALHGLATLTRARRLPAQDTGRRVELLVDRLALV